MITREANEHVEGVMARVPVKTGAQLTLA